MKPLRRFWQRLRGTVGRARRDAELMAEIESHLRLQADDNVRRGMSPEAARRAAALKFGGVEAAKEAYRDDRGVPFLEHAISDLRYGVRQLIARPGFAAVVVATLALGIGANTAVFSIVYAVLLSNPPFVEPARLVTLTQSFPSMGEGRLGVSPPEYVDYRDRTRTFAALAGYSRTSFYKTGDAEPEPIDAVLGTASLFTALGVSTHIGRTFTTAEEAEGAAKVAVLSFDYWRRRYGGNSEAVGSTITLNEQAYTIVGVMPARFEFPAGSATAQAPPAAWVPLSYSQRQLADRAGSFGTRVVARLAPGVSLEQARDDVARVAADLEREHPDIYTGALRLRATVDPLMEVASAPARPVLLILAAAVGLVLLIACANVANLLLVRASARQKEMAVRRALGAERGRIIRQLLTESLLLSGLGGLLGCALAVGLTSAAATLWHGQVISFRGVEVNEQVLAFAVGVAMLTGIVCGLAPAFELAGPSVGEALKQSVRQAGGGRQRRLLRHGLVMFETACALVLLVGAALLVHSFVNVLSVPLGFDPDGVLVVRTAFNRERYPDAVKRHTAQRLILERLSALPGIRAVGLTTHIPLADDRKIGFATERERQRVQWAANALVSPEYFAAMGIPITRGRTFSDADTATAPLAAVVNEALARRHWPNQDPIGERVLWGRRSLTVVGVAGDVHIAALDAEVEPTVYCSVFQVESGATTSAVLILRTGRNDTGAAPAARAVIQSVDAGLPAFDIRPMTEVVGRSLAQRRFTVAVLSVFAAFALVLTVVGLYAVLSHAVAQRTQEFGIRVAVGATPAELTAMIVMDGLRLVMAGLVIGLVAALTTVRSLSVLLFGVGALDPVAFVGAAGLLLMISLLASYRVGRRAATIDPMTALRAE